MAGRLPGELVDEAKSTLDSVGRIKLPSRVWWSVRQHLSSVDSAVGADDPAALRIALDELHRMGVDPWRLPSRSRSSGAPKESSAPKASSRPSTTASGTPAQPPPPGWLPPLGSIPEMGRLPPAGSANYPDAPAPTMGQQSGASRSRRIVAIAVGVIGILFGGAFVAAVVLDSTAQQGSLPTEHSTTVTPLTGTRAPETSEPPAVTSHTFTSPGMSTTSGVPTYTPTPSETPLIPSLPGATPPITEAPPPGADESESLEWIVAVGLLALAGIVLIAVVVLRLRSRSSPTPAHVEAVADRYTGPPGYLPAPKEVVEFANRTVMRLVEYGGTS